VVFPAVAFGYYFGYNVSSVTLVLVDDEIRDFSSLNITFSEIQLKSAGALTVSEWTTIGLSTRTVDLVSLGSTGRAELGIGRLPAGEYSHVRVIVDTALGRDLNGGVVAVKVASGDLDASVRLQAQGSVVLTLRMVVMQTGNDYLLRTSVAGIDDA